MTLAEMIATMIVNGNLAAARQRLGTVPPWVLIDTAFALSYLDERELRQALLDVRNLLRPPAWPESLSHNATA